MEKSQLNKYESTVKGGLVSICKGDLPPDIMPENLSSRLVTAEITLDWIYKFRSDEFIHYSIRKSSDSDLEDTILKLEVEVRLIAATICEDYNIDINAIKEADIAKQKEIEDYMKARQKADELADLEDELM